MGFEFKWQWLGFEDLRVLGQEVKQWCMVGFGVGVAYEAQGWRAAGRRDVKVMMVSQLCLVVVSME